MFIMSLDESCRGEGGYLADPDGCGCCGYGHPDPNSGRPISMEEIDRQNDAFIARFDRAEKTHKRNLREVWVRDNLPTIYRVLRYFYLY